MYQQLSRRLKKPTWITILLLTLFLTPCRILNPPPTPIEIPADSRVSELQAGRTTLAAGDTTDIRVGIVKVVGTEVPVNYQWSATGGAIIMGQGTCCITYQAPERAGAYQISLAVGYGDQLVQRSTSLEVLPASATPEAPLSQEPTPLPTPVVPQTTPLPSEPPLPDAAAYFERGQDFYVKRDLEKALADFAKAIEFNYDPLSDPYYQRGYIYYLQRDYRRAIEGFTRAIELNYDPIGLAYYNRGNAYYYNGNSDQAIVDYTQAIELEHEPLSWLYNSRGLAYRKKGAFDQAIADYTQAIELGHDPLHWPYYNRGNAYADQGVYERAIADYSEAIRLDAGLEAAYYARGVAYKQLGDVNAAAADFNKVLGLNDDYWRQEAEKQLQVLGTE